MRTGGKKKPRTGEKEKLWKKQGKNRESEPAGERETNTDEKKSKKKRLRERRLVTEKNSRGGTKTSFHPQKLSKKRKGWPLS